MANVTKALPKIFIGGAITAALAIGAFTLAPANAAEFEGAIAPATLTAEFTPATHVADGQALYTEARFRGGRSFRGSRGFRGNRGFRGGRGFKGSRGFKGKRGYYGKGYSSRGYYGGKFAGHHKGFHDGHHNKGFHGDGFHKGAGLKKGVGHHSKFSHGKGVIGKKY